ncbi:hypothetical protein CBR_g9216 [Chara braunii]|uniref:Uncharacterized protein n=1 Tax=Chara braunii TaxID=69332 RepID=A0A388KP45_CHABU|nr:hypothetical protein CBR_g9216 [Chara braunii]|eukprot:GBG71807.1 hypothetical protein CBR_g9216 [Chara braunii]
MLQLSTPFVSFNCNLQDFANIVPCHKLQMMDQVVLRTTISVCSPKAVGKSCGEPKTSGRMSKSRATSIHARRVRKSTTPLQSKGVSDSAKQAQSHVECAAHISLSPTVGTTDHEDDDEKTKDDSPFLQPDGEWWAEGDNAKDTEDDDDEQRFLDGAEGEEESLEDGWAQGDGGEDKEDGSHKGDESEEEEDEDASDEDSYEGGSEGDEGGANDNDGGNSGSQKRQEEYSQSPSHHGPSEEDGVLHGIQKVCMHARKENESWEN